MAKFFEECPCRHERLTHDSWGCKNSGCRCGISVIYLTPLNRTKKSSKAKDEETIRLGNELVAEDDRVEESRLKALYNRMLGERAAR